MRYASPALVASPLGSSLLFLVCSRSLQWLPFEVDDTSQERGSQKQWVTMLAGGSAGALVWLPPSYCFDVVKSRIQYARPGQYRNTWDCIRQTYQAEGQLPSPIFV